MDSISQWLPCPLAFGLDETNSDWGAPPTATSSIARMKGTSSEQKPSASLWSNGFTQLRTFRNPRIAEYLVVVVVGGGGFGEGTRGHSPHKLNKKCHLQHSRFNFLIPFTKSKNAYNSNEHPIQQSFSRLKR